MFQIYSYNHHIKYIAVLCRVLSNYVEKIFLLKSTRQTFNNLILFICSLNADVVQWLEYGLAKAVTWIRLPSSAPYENKRFIKRFLFYFF